MAGRLFIVATPIGNLSDISQRARSTLDEVDVVVAEDTRRSGLLLKKLGIKKPLVSLFLGNEKRRTARVIEMLKEGSTIALVSDAGTPLISDPGYSLVREAIREGVEIVHVPGPSAILTALVLSGLPTDRFTFVGYPPDKTGKRRSWLEGISKLDHTIVMFLSPWKIGFMLKDVIDILGDRPACLCRELTKLHEEVIRGQLSEIIDKIKNRKSRGEYTIVIGTLV